MRIDPVSRDAPTSAEGSADGRALALVVGVLLLGVAALAFGRSAASNDEEIRPVPASEKEPAPRPGRRF
jgi:hypothetical protein